MKIRIYHEAGENLFYIQVKEEKHWLTWFYSFLYEGRFGNNWDFVLNYYRNVLFAGAHTYKEIDSRWETIKRSHSWIFPSRSFEEAMRKLEDFKKWITEQAMKEWRKRNLGIIYHEEEVRLTPAELNKG